MWWVLGDKRQSQTMRVQEPCTFQWRAEQDAEILQPDPDVSGVFRLT